MLKKSFRRKSKKLKSKKRVSKKSQKKITKKKAFSPSAIVIIPVVIGTLGLLTASGYYGIKYYKEKKFKDDISTFRQEIAIRAEICSICQDSISYRDYQELPCKHIFHKDCIQKWEDTRFRTVDYWKIINNDIIQYKLDYTCPNCKDIYNNIKTNINEYPVDIIREAGKIVIWAF